MTSQQPAAGSALASATELGDVASAISRIVAALNAQQAEMANLHDAVALLDGRTQRYEAGQESARAAGQEIDDILDRLDRESTFRRDLVSALERRAQQEQGDRSTLVTQLEALQQSVESLQSRLDADSERGARVDASIALQRRGEDAMESRMRELEQQVAANREDLNAARTDHQRASGGWSEVETSIEALRDRAKAAEEAQHRLQQDVAILRAVGERETELLEVTEQQRAARQRLEERLAQFDSELEETRIESRSAAEERSMFRRQVAGEQQHLRDLAESLEAQRDLILEHFRRWTESNTQAGRREVEEIERVNREARDLLVRLTERTDESSQEQTI
jgi:chromosome segregation ATPase